MGQRFRVWWAHRQGLDGGLVGSKPAEVLERAGWARSVGGANPYLTLFSRAGISRETAEKAAADLQIHELPSARGCTYVLPKSDFALGLRVGQGFGEEAEINVAKKYLGVTEKELDKLSEKVLSALKKSPQDPKALKESAGDAIRNLGDEGKKRGVTTTLPLVLGRLQSSGQIRRVPANGRLDQQRYSYVVWNPPTLDISKEEAYEKLARKYFKWIGPATMSDFQWFSALNVGAAKAALAELKLQPIEKDTQLLLLPEDFDEFHSFKMPKEPNYSLVAGIDSMFLLRRDIASLLEAADAKRQVFEEKGLRRVGDLKDLPSHAILDRGRIVGLWEFEPSSGEVAWLSWVPKDSELKAAVKNTEAFVRDQLGDARSFSLDSPESRAPRIAAIRA